jgi:hypothetical protein
MNNEQILELLKKHEDLDLFAISRLTGITFKALSEAQLQMTRTHIKRDSVVWDLVNFGR